MATYTPGYKAVKFYILLFGLFLFCAGIVQLFSPAWMLLTGTTKSAKITRIVFSNAASPQADSGNSDQKKFYSYWATTAGSDSRELPLNVHYGSESAYHVGDAITVVFSHDSKSVAAAYVVDDLQTWAVGILFVIFGAAFSVSFYLIWSRADLPIELPVGTPQNFP